MGEAVHAVISDLVTAYRILVNEGILDSFGHVSVRSPNDPSRFIMPRAMPPSLVEVGDFLELDVGTSQAVDPQGRRTNGERYLHGEIYKARPDVHAIVHSHSPAVLPLAIAGLNLQPVIVQAGFLPRAVPTFEIREMRCSGRGMQITDRARGEALARCLGDKSVALLAGHGDVIASSSVRRTVVYAAYTAINARMQIEALRLNRDIRVLDDAERFEEDEFDINRPWEHLRQKLLGRELHAQIDREQFGLAHTQAAN